MQHNKEIRIHALLLGILSGLVICAVTPFNNLYLRATLLGGGHFPLAPFFLTAWIIVACAAFRKVTGKTLFSGMETLMIWALSTLVSGIPYTGLVRTFLLNLTMPTYFATPGNRWGETLQPIMPHDLYPTDPKAVEALYDGLPGGASMDIPTVFAQIPWAAWISPFLWWGAFLLLSYLVIICIVNILSRQWIVNERMNLPLMRLPQVMSNMLDEGNVLSFFSNRFLICGVLVSVFIHTLNGLSGFYPDIPQIPTLIFAGHYFPKYGLFSGFYKLKIYIYPAFIGFAFLTTRQISFSLWSFFLVGGLMYGLLDIVGLNIPQSALGVTFGPTVANVEETQMIGAYIVFFLFIIWLARQHLMATLRAAIMPGKNSAASDEWISLRTSFWGMIIGFTLLVAWGMNFGMSMLASTVVMLSFFIVTIVASRVICQGGIAYFTLTTAPLDGVLTAFGSKFLGTTGLLVAAAAQKTLFVDLRESLMPSLVHTAKASEGASNKRMIFGSLLLVIILAAVVSFAAMLALCYKYGLRELDLDWATRTSHAVYDNVHRLVETPMDAQPWVVTFSIVGAVIMAALVFGYHRFHWWPIHPIGYLATYSSAMRILWFSFFIGWLVNQLTLRYGGVTLFNKVRYLFFGFILGDFLMGGAWAIIGLQTGMSYQVLPN